MGSLVLGFQEMGEKQLWLVGGKGLNLGELSKIQGIQVPEGFCVTTVGYRKAIEQIETNLRAWNGRVYRIIVRKSSQPLHKEVGYF